MAPPTDPIRRGVENLFTLQRLANSLSLRSRRLLQEVFADVAAQLARIDPMGVRADTYRVRRLQRLIDELRPIIQDGFGEWRKVVRGELAAIGAQQAQHARGLLGDSLGGTTAMGRFRISLSDPTGLGVNLFKSIVDTDPFQGDTLAGWASGQARTTRDRVRRQIQLGMTQGETLDQLIRRVRGRSIGSGRYAGGVMATTTREAESVVRTATNEIANRAHLETFQREDDVTDEYRYVATLDTRTSDICIGLDGQSFRYDDPQAKRPPQHFQCRSTIVPIIKWAELGMEEPDPLTRSSMDGPVSGSLNYEDWLRSQPAGIQDEVLGPSRGRLFRQGKVGLKDLVRSDGSTITVAELPGGSDLPPKPKKTPTGPPGGPSLRKAIRAREKEIFNADIEYATAWDPQAGKVVLDKTSGLVDGVNFTPEEVAPLGDAVFTHNHPRSSSFSPEDINFALGVNLAEIRVTSRRYDYSLVRPEPGWPGLDEIIEISGPIHEALKVEFWAMIDSGQITPDEASIQHFHQLWRRTFSALGMGTSYTRRVHK